MQTSRLTNEGNSDHAAAGSNDLPPRRQSKSQTPPQIPFPDVQPRRDPENLGLRLQPNNANTSVNGLGVRRHNSQRVGRVSAASTSGDPTNRSLQRVMSPAGGESTPRSSMDIYSHSNHSSDTLQSEYVAPINAARPLMHRREGSQLGPSRPDSQTLMMGYVQLVGSFTLEGSLVNMAPFEAVKRKAIIGGQGSGGVVGIETARRDNGLFGSLGWGSIGQSLGGLLGPEEPSSIREMKGIASSKSIPIISTAQSILFVDLQLRPGESKQFTYSHSLPQGIPPTFKGRAIKCSYHIVVGTQRPHHSRAQQPGRPQHSVRQIEVPFKVQPAINEAGEVLGHDLMNPHVILRDMSKTQLLHTGDAKSARRSAAAPTRNEGDAEFKAYVKELLEGTRKDSGAGLLSPTSTVPMYASPAGHPAKVQHPQVPAKELIDMAIAQQAASGSARTSSTSLQISRGGEKVAKVLLARTAFRVGETVVGSVDFSGADVACFTFNAALESAEVVDPAIALRSGASIHRATRRVHAHTSENTVCAERVSFALTIPPSATPDFLTSGVRLEWKLRLEFVTADTQLGEPMRDLLDINEEGERGVFSSATQELPYQSFEVPVALRIYGNVGGDSEASSAQGYRI
jgi:RAB6A-GEF complex partner protein 2